MPSKWKSKLVTMALKVLHHLTPVHLSGLTKCQLWPQSLYSCHTGPKLLNALSSSLPVLWTFFSFCLVSLPPPETFAWMTPFHLSRLSLNVISEKPFSNNSTKCLHLLFLSQSLILFTLQYIHCLYLDICLLVCLLSSLVKCGFHKGQKAYPGCYICIWLCPE